MTADERRTARLWEVPEAEVKPVPSPLSRALQRVQMKRGALSYLEHGLGDAPAGAPRVLLRFDEFPNYAVWSDPERDVAAFRRFHATLREAGVPYLVAVLPRVPRDWADPEDAVDREWTAEEREVLLELRRDAGVAFGLHGYDHRTRSVKPRRHSELLGLGETELEERLDKGQAALRELALDARVFVAPYNRFTRRHWPVLAKRFDVVTGGPESVALMGFHPPAQFRGDAVYLPSYPPLYGTAAEVADGVERLLGRGRAVWAPAVLHLRAEMDDGFAGLRRLAGLLAGGVARPWQEFLDHVERSAKAA